MCIPSTRHLCNCCALSATATDVKLVPVDMFAAGLVESLCNLGWVLVRDNPKPVILRGCEPTSAYTLILLSLRSAMWFL